MMERLNNVADDMRELKQRQGETNQMLLMITGMQKDMTHMDEKVRHLFAVSDMRGQAMERIDKRLTSLERWHKVVGAVLLAATGAIGWGVQRIEYLYRMDTRIQILELLINQQNVERAIQPPAATSK